jgi:serine/threonine protein kinase
MDLVGQKIDNYRLIRYLGKGSFGEVFLAEHVSKHTQFAIKLLRMRLSPETMVNFLNEARIMRLHHPNIMRIVDFGIVEDVPFLVMDYIPGGTMRQRHPFGSKVPLQTVVDYVKQISEALQYAHDEGLVHRDVKPENMLIGPNNEILLSDFGIVTNSYTWSPGNAPGVAGTALYMAPEQIQARPVRASDQYALGVIVYEWLAGMPPFRGTLPELTVKHLTQPPPSLCDSVPNVSQAVEQVIMKALAKDPKGRYASIKEFAEALQQASKPPIGTTLSVFRGHTDWITALDWSPDGVNIASASNDRTVMVWDAAKATTIYTYHGHAREVTSVGWSPDGTRIASSSCDGTVQVWEGTTGKRILTYH